MAQELLNSFEEKGLSCPFIAARSGDVTIASSGESLKNEIAQMTTVIYETIGAVGDIDIDQIELLADVKCLVLTIDKQNLLGSLFDQSDGIALENIWATLQELKDQSSGVAVVEKAKVRELAEEKPEEVPKVEVEERPKEVPEVKVKEKPEEKPKVKIDAGMLDTMKDAIKDYLGDFTDRIFKNQLKAQRIKPEEFYDADARRLIFALGKAAGMIIGPSKGQKMTNKLLELLK